LRCQCQVSHWLLIWAARVGEVMMTRVALLSIDAVLFAFGCGLVDGALKELLRLQEQLSEIIERQAERRAQLIEATRG
jgi:hypothetical protein